MLGMLRIQTVTTLQQVTLRGWCNTDDSSLFKLFQLPTVVPCKLNDSSQGRGCIKGYVKVLSPTWVPKESWGTRCFPTLANRAWILAVEKPHARIWALKFLVIVWPLRGIDSSEGATNLLGPGTAMRDTHVRDAHVGRIAYSLASDKEFLDLSSGPTVS